MTADDDADFIELRRRVAMLTPERLDQLTNELWSDQLSRLCEQLTQDIRIFDNEEKPFDVA